jgi:hypothetical protein
MTSLDEFNEYIKKILPRVADFTKSELEEWVETSIKAKNVASCPFFVDKSSELEIYIRSLL